MTEYLLLFRNASAESGYLASNEDMLEDMPILKYPESSVEIRALIPFVNHNSN